MEETARVGVGVVAEERAATACAVALRRLDLEHLSAQKSHQLRCKRSGNSVAAFNHTELVKRQAFHRFSYAFAMIQFCIFASLCAPRRLTRSALKLGHH